VAFARVFSLIAKYHPHMRRYFLVGLVALAACAPASNSSDANTPAQRLFEQAANLLQRNYYGFSKADLPGTIQKYREVVAKACSGQANCAYPVAGDALEKMVDELQDPHTFYETPEAFADSQRTQNGQGAAVPRLGVNWVFREASNAWLIVDTTAGLPAQEAGLARGDLVASLNGKALPKGAEASNAALRDAIRSGKTFSLGVKRGGVARDVKAQGKIVNLPPLPYQRRWNTLPSKIALLRIPDFSPPTVSREFHKLVNQNSAASAIIVDLRSNPGGRTTECVGSPGAFLQKLEVVLSQRDDSISFQYDSGRVSIEKRPQYTINPAALYKGKVAVLVNADSASCSELMSAVLQYFKRATIIGEPTYGILNTGTTEFRLMDGGGLSVTIVRTLDPSGKPYPERVTPNVAQKEDLDALEATGKDVMLDRAVQVLQGADALMNAPLPVAPMTLSLPELQRRAVGY
jgi:carboxyl-terminal processing protease